jgi:hypothetical protein
VVTISVDASLGSFRPGAVARVRAAQAPR